MKQFIKRMTLVTAIVMLMSCIPFAGLAEGEAPAAAAAETDGITASVEGKATPVPSETPVPTPTPEPLDEAIYLDPDMTPVPVGDAAEDEEGIYNAQTDIEPEETPEPVEGAPLPTLAPLTLRATNRVSVRGEINFDQTVPLAKQIVISVFLLKNGRQIAKWNSRTGFAFTKLMKFDENPLGRIVIDGKTYVENVYQIAVPRSIAAEDGKYFLSLEGNDITVSFKTKEQLDAEAALVVTPDPNAVPSPEASGKPDGAKVLKLLTDPDALTVYEGDILWGDLTPFPVRVILSDGQWSIVKKHYRFAVPMYEECGEEDAEYCTADGRFFRVVDLEEKYSVTAEPVLRDNGVYSFRETANSGRADTLKPQSAAASDGVRLAAVGRVRALRAPYRDIEVVFHETKIVTVSAVIDEGIDPDTLELVVEASYTDYQGAKQNPSFSFNKTDGWERTLEMLVAKEDRPSYSVVINKSSVPCYVTVENDTIYVHLLASDRIRARVGYSEMMKDAPSEVAVPISDSNGSIVIRNVLTDGTREEEFFWATDGVGYSVVTSGASAFNVPGYEYEITEDNGLFTILLIPAKTMTYAGTIRWKQAGVINEPTHDPIVLSLYNADTGTTMGTIIAPEGAESFSFAPVPAYKSDGSLYAYGVRVTNLPERFDVSSSYTVKNSEVRAALVISKPDAKGLDLRVRFEWVDDDNERGYRPESIKVVASKDGESSSKQYCYVRGADEWVNYIQNLARYDKSGQSIPWTLLIPEIPMYRVHISYIVRDEVVVTCYFSYHWNEERAWMIPDLNDPMFFEADERTDTEKEKLQSQYTYAFTEMQEIAGLAHKEDGTIDMAALRKKSSDIVAWLTQEGTWIDAPIMRPTTDEEFYLKHTFLRKGCYPGTPFVDRSCNSNFVGQNTIVYGRNMSDGTLFESLTNYSMQEYYDAHPKMTLHLRNEVYDVEVSAAFTVGDLREELPAREFASGDDFLAEMNDCALRSDIQTNVSFEPTDRIITLVTGTNANNANRYVVIGRLVRQ